LIKAASTADLRSVDRSLVAMVFSLSRVLLKGLIIKKMVLKVKLAQARTSPYFVRARSSPVAFFGMFFFWRQRPGPIPGVRLNGSRRKPAGRRERA